MSQSRISDIAAVLVCRHEHGELVCRPPALLAVSVGVVVAVFLLVLMINTLATLRRR